MKYLLCTLFVTLFVLAASAQPASSRYQLVRMDKTVNSFHHEGAPMVSPDGKTLYFFVNNHPENTHGKENSQDIWMSSRDANGQWTQAVHMKSPFNIHSYNQLFTVFEDGTLFIKGGRSKGEKGFSLVSAGGSLQELNVKDFKNMNQGRFYGATMSGDKKHIIMYFSEKDGSISSDLYVSHAQNDGSWTRPEKLAISSPQDDVAPFVGPDQKTLYFASARPAAGRQGQTDIYKCERLDESWSKFSTPVNLGKPVNTGGDDFYFTMDKAGNVFTSQSNKVGGDIGQLDIFMLIPKTMNINLEGLVFNEKTNEPVPSSHVTIRLAGKDPQKATVSPDGTFKSKFQETSEIVISASAEGFIANEVKTPVKLLMHDTTMRIDIPLTPVAKKLIIVGTALDQKTNNPVNAHLQIVPVSDKKAIKVTASDGNYEQEVPALGTYVITASAEGYLSATDSIELDDAGRSPFRRDIYLQPIEVGVTVVLKNIFFDFDRTTLKSESNTELNKVVDFLRENPSVEIEISGHTDNKGSDDYNLKLSQGRSEAVMNYLVTKGIAAGRLQARGYGETKPVDTNDTDEGRAVNRRVEFTILKK